MNKKELTNESKEQRAKWVEERYFYGIFGYRCSNCGKLAPRESYATPQNKWAFCPYCGTKMIVDSENEEK